MQSGRMPFLQSRILWCRPFTFSPPTLSTVLKQKKILFVAICNKEIFTIMSLYIVSIIYETTARERIKLDLYRDPRKERWFG